jgi:hypothetical protein
MRVDRPLHEAIRPKARELDIPLVPSTLRGEDDSYRQNDEQLGPTRNVTSTRF